MRKWRVVGRIYGMKCSRKGHKNRNRHTNRKKKSGQARLVYVENITVISHHVTVSPWGQMGVGICNRHCHRLLACCFG